MDREKYHTRSVPKPRTECPGTSMQSRPINFSITKPIFRAYQIHDVCGDVACCCVRCSPIICRANAVLATVSPPPTSHTLSNNFHNRISAVIAVLSFSRPRALRLARSVSSRAFFLLRQTFAWHMFLCNTYNFRCPKKET